MTVAKFTLQVLVRGGQQSPGGLAPQTAAPPHPVRIPLRPHPGLARLQPAPRRPGEDRGEGAAACPDPHLAAGVLRSTGTPGVCRTHGALHRWVSRPPPPLLSPRVLCLTVSEKAAMTTPFRNPTLCQNLHGRGWEGGVVSKFAQSEGGVDKNLEQSEHLPVLHGFSRKRVHKKQGDSTGMPTLKPWPQSPG